MRLFEETKLKIMRKSIKHLSAYLLLAFMAYLMSCKKDKQRIAAAPVSTVSTTTTASTPSVICGTAQPQSLIAGQNMVAGSVTVSNDATNLYVTYTTVNGWQIQKTHLYVGKCSLIPTSGGGNPQVGLFPYQTTYSPRVTTCTYTLPLSALDSCYCIASHAELVQVDSLGNIIQSQTGWGQGSPFGGNSWAMKFTYCTQYCTSSPCVINLGDFRTQTQGGWGATPQGNNPGAYLHTNFSTAFPNGVVVGCSTYTITLTTAQDVTNFLTQGGTPAVLTQSYLNPLTINNVLAGQLVSLTISVGFDAAIPNFSSSSTPLSSLVITSGTFTGWTVAQLLAEANKVLGGCPSIYTASQINTALDMINNNFDNGTVAGGYLSCQ